MEEKQESPIILAIRDKITELRNFISYIDKNGSKKNPRTPVKIAINFEHRRFPENNKGFAVLNCNDYGIMSSLVGVLKEETFRQIELLEQQILMLNDRQEEIN